MPYRRSYRYRPRKYRGKKRYSGRKVFKRVIHKMKKTGLQFYKLRQHVDATTDVAGNILYRFTNSNPNAYVSLNGAGYATALRDWGNVSGLFDQYRVCAVKIKYIPSLPNDTSVTTGFTPMYVIHDMDSDAPPGTVNDMIEYEHLRTKNLYKPFKLYYKVPKISNPNSTGPTVGYGWFDVANPVGTGCIQLLSNSLDVSTTYGTFIATYYIAVKNRR